FPPPAWLARIWTFLCASPADDAEWMSGQSRARLAPVLTEASPVDVGPEHVRLSGSKIRWRQDLTRRLNLDSGGDGGIRCRQQSSKRRFTSPPSRHCFSRGEIIGRFPVNQGGQPVREEVPAEGMHVGEPITEKRPNAILQLGIAGCPFQELIDVNG